MKRLYQQQKKKKKKKKKKEQTGCLSRDLGSEKS